MPIRKIPSILTQSMRKQYPGQIPETPFMKILGKLRWASRGLPSSTVIPRVTLFAGSISEGWAGIDHMTETLVIKTPAGQIYNLKEDPLRVEVKMKVLAGEALQRAKREILHTLKIVQQKPGAGGIEGFTQDHGDPPYSPYAGLSCNEKVINEELRNIMNILRRGIK